MLRTITAPCRRSSSTRFKEYAGRLIDFVRAHYEIGSAAMA